MRKRKAKPEEAKTITINSLETLDTNLRIKLKFDDITKFWFFNEYIKGYLLDDPLLQPFIEKIKESSMMARKHKLKKNRQLLEKEKEIKNKFGLNPDEIENIFDLIEMSHRLLCQLIALFFLDISVFHTELIPLTCIHHYLL